MIKTFSRYQVFLISILVFLQFTVILDFMILSPFGIILLQELNITAFQFGIVVSAYAWSAGISCLLAAGFAIAMMYFINKMVNESSSRGSCGEKL